MKTSTSCWVILIIWISTSIICLPEFILARYADYGYENDQNKVCGTDWSNWEFLQVIRESFQIVVLLVVGILCCWIFFTMNCQEEGPEISLQSTWEAKAGRKLTELTYCIGPMFALCCVPFRILLIFFTITLPLQTSLSKGTQPTRLN
ncbi:unnamed protein product [Allacma fusca]|uniref:Uncharacterized protein n=1 Tax=Allacma fusca TaxID=39272 RepID=A0A8J2LHW1_9HEXA|nr:unnamed protein product [Allacma fusca]